MPANAILAIRAQPDNLQPIQEVANPVAAMKIANRNIEEVNHWLTISRAQLHDVRMPSKVHAATDMFHMAHILQTLAIRSPHVRDLMTHFSTRHCFRPDFVWKLTAVVAVLCLITAGNRHDRQDDWRNDRISGGQHHRSTLHEIVIGNDVLLLPANVIRFESQRISGVQGAVDTYFAWPGMSGYTRQTGTSSTRPGLPTD
jgi:hypothetical protein